MNQNVIPKFSVFKTPYIITRFRNCGPDGCKGKVYARSQPIGQGISDATRRQ